MSANTTNQQITYPVGTDLADNPTAFLDMLADVEGRLVQRYTSNADRTARNPAPAIGEMSIVTTNTWYDRWTGVKWLPCTDISVMATADQTVNNSTALVNSLSLFVPLPVASTNYFLTGALRYTTNATADFKFDFTGPAGATMLWGGPFLDTAAAAATGSAFFGETVAPGTTGAGGFGTTSYTPIMASITTGANTGTLTLRFAQNTLNASNTVLNAFSFLSLKAIG